MLTGGLERVRCKARVLRNTGAYTISYVRISEGRQRRPLDLDQGPERREGQIARYSAPPPNDLRFELPTGPGFLEAFKKGLDTRPEFRGIPEAYMAHTSRISEGG